MLKPNLSCKSASLSGHLDLDVLPGYQSCQVVDLEHDNVQTASTRARAVAPLDPVLFDRQQCEAWMERLRRGEISDAQLWEAARHQPEVVTQIRFLQRVCKA